MAEIKINLDDLVDIARCVEAGDPIEWDKLAVGQEEAFKLIATSVIEMFDKDLSTYENRMIVMATITKLIVENMLLHTKLMKPK